MKIDQMNRKICAKRFLTLAVCMVLGGGIALAQTSGTPSKATEDAVSAPDLGYSFVPAVDPSFHSDDFYEVSSVKAMSGLMLEDSLVLPANMAARSKTVTPIDVESDDAKLGKVLAVFFVLMILVALGVYGLSTAYLLRVSRRAHKLRIDTLSMYASDTWRKECELDAKKTRHWDAKWDEIPDEPEA